MRIGIEIVYWPWLDIQEQIALGTLADELGFHSLWVSETWGQDGVALLGHLSAVTTQIKLGAAVLQIPARRPTALAASVATLNALSGDRVMLGLGLSGPQVSEGWYGVPFTAPLARTREYLEIVRAALTGAAVDYAGEQFRIPERVEGLGLGKPLKLLAPRVGDQVPIYLGVSGPKTVEQAGRIADGWLPFLFDPNRAEALLAPLLAGIAASGRSRGDVDVAPIVPVAIDADIAVARNQIRPFLAFYLGAMGAKDKNFYVEQAERSGHGDAARACQACFLAGDKKGAERHLTDGLIDAFAIAATPATLERRLGDYAAAGIDTLIAAPFGDKQRALRLLAAHR